MEFQGTVNRIMPEIKGTSARGDWQRQEVIFSMMDGAYERKVAVTFFNKPADVLALKEGVTYNVSFNLESREYNNRWYTDVRAWRVQIANQEAAPAPEPSSFATPAAAPLTTPQTATAAPATADDSDDLPF